MNSTTNKEKWWIYLIFLFVGIISLFSGLFIGRIPLFDGGLLVMLLPLPICSVLLHLVIKYYSTEKYSSTFIFVALAASILIFLIGYIVPFGPFFLLLILFAIGSIIFKNDRHKKFALTAFTISFAAIFLIFGAILALGAYNHEMGKGIHIQKITAIDENTPYMEIHEQELEAFPGLKDALNRCREFGECGHNLLPDEWRSVRKFLDEKNHRQRYLFTISPEIENKLGSDDFDPEMSPIQSKNVPGDLKLIFESNNITLSEFASVGYNDYSNNWLIYERSFLFLIEEPDLIEKLNTMKIYKGDGSLEDKDLITIPELGNSFESINISISKQYWIHRYAENWHIIGEKDPNMESFEIWEVDGDLNVYTDYNSVYEIWKEDGNLNVYKRDDYDNDKIFKVGDDYYTFLLWLA
jgi:hypothetical protein